MNIAQQQLAVTLFAIISSFELVDNDLQAAALELSDDAWHTWQVRAIEGSSERCCFDRVHGSTAMMGCDLDNGRSIGARNSGQSNSADRLQIYARTTAGEVTDIQALSSQCAVEADTAIRDMGFIRNTDSVSWLRSFVSPRSGISSEALSAIAGHSGNASLTVLRNTARSDTNADNRKDAVFWMAQSGRQQSEAELGHVIKQDSRPDVRKHAVFALSLLPDKRGTVALVAILENRELTMTIREQALFWLAQSDSDEAFVYIDALLSRR